MTVDLGRTMPVSKVAFASLWRPYDMLWPVSELHISTSADNKVFTSAHSGKFTYDFTPTEGTCFPASLSFPEIMARYVCLEFVYGGPCPKGYYHEGQPSRLAIDEIELY
ncbi:hypothetical protein SFC43_30515 [Bacteroides sp. CR5/BHMF/2]|nr:hypothetical protein [Bacteroides sp. CR5/BHMF/2]